MSNFYFEKCPTIFAVECTSREVIRKIRKQEGVVKIDKSIIISYQTKKLLKGMLNPDPSKRITIKEILEELNSEYTEIVKEKEPKNKNKNKHNYDTEIVPKHEESKINNSFTQKKRIKDKNNETEVVKTLKEEKKRKNAKQKDEEEDNDENCENTIDKNIFDSKSKSSTSKNDTAISSEEEFDETVKLLMKLTNLMDIANPMKHPFEQCTQCYEFCEVEDGKLKYVCKCNTYHLMENSILFNEELETNIQNWRNIKSRIEEIICEDKIVRELTFPKMIKNILFIYSERIRQKELFKHISQSKYATFLQENSVKDDKHPLDLSICSLCNCEYKDGEKFVFLPCLHTMHLDTCYEFTVCENGMCSCRVNVANIFVEINKKF